MLMSLCLSGMRLRSALLGAVVVTALWSGTVAAVGPDLVIMDGRRALIAAGPSHGEEVAPGFIVASGDALANDVMGIEILQQWYPTIQNRITMYVWNLPQIQHAVKLGIGYARGPDDIKVVI